MLIDLIVIIQSDIFLYFEDLSYSGFIFNDDFELVEENNNDPLALLRMIFHPTSEYADLFCEARIQVVSELINRCKPLDEPSMRLLRLSDQLAQDINFNSDKINFRTLQLIKFILRANVDPLLYEYPKAITSEIFIKKKVAEYYLQSVKLLEQMGLDK